MSKALKNKLLSSCFSKRGDNSIFPNIGNTSYDLTKLVDGQVLYKWIHDINDKKIELTFFENPQEIIDKLNKTNSVDEVKKIFEQFDVPIPKILCKKLTDNFSQYLQEAVEKFHDAIINGADKILKLFKTANEKFKDTSMWYLYVGAYYISGYSLIGDGAIINAPLIVFPVEIKRDSKTGVITLEKKQNLYSTNNKLNYLINNSFNYEIPDFETDNINEFDIYCNWLKNQLNNLNSKDFITKHFDTFQINPMDGKNITSPWEIHPFVTISLMDPNGGVILKDVNEIIELGKDPFSVGSLFKKDDYVESVLKNDDLISINHNPNIYQKYAISAALNENTLIYGPPGTGKSEVIANLIANIIYREKTVLMCSEKKAALDVLVERLGDLSALAIDIYDTENKSSFYTKIRNLYEIINSFSNLDPNNLKNKINKNNVQKLNDIQKIYLMDNELIDLNLTNDISCFLSKPYDILYHNCFGPRISSWEKENNEKLTFEKLNSIIEDTKYFNNFYLSNEELINFFNKNNVKLTKTNIDNFLVNYDNTKDKYKDFYLNQFLNTGCLKKPGLFNHKKQKKWNNFDESTSLLKIKKLLDFKDDVIDFKNIINKKENFDKLSIISEKDIIFYNELIQVNNIFKRYNFSTETKVNEKINEYYKISEKNSNNNSLLILNWHLAKIVKFIKSLETSQIKNDELLSSIKEVFRISNLKRFPPISSFIKKHYEALRILFPIWIMSTTEISVNIPNEENVFDYGIFDEASQMLVENSYPAVYRCRNICVAGDDKQLKPTTFFTSQYMASDDEIDEDENYSLVSLLDKAKTSLWYEFNLKNHYRSTSSKLIEFSNKYIYDNNLETATKNGCFYDSIEVYNVKGIWDGTRNSVEIDKILDYIKENYNQQAFIENEKWLIITCNIKQQIELDSRFALLAYNEPILRDAYEKDLIKFRNIENVQGDEANIVLLSLTYGPNCDGKVIQNFGPLNRDEGPNRLNVAITRAKEKMIIFKSLNAEMIPNLSENPNVDIFKKFIQFVDEYGVSKDDEKSQANIIFANQENLIFDSNFEEDVYQKLNTILDKNKYKIITQFPVGSKKIDMVIIDKNTKNVIVGLEVDGFRYHSGYRKIMEDIDRQNFLEARGYRIYRIKEIDWINRPQVVLEQIINLIS